jgi:signal peptidase I
VLPWVLSVLLAFLIIKFLVFPTLGLLFGSELPLVAVMSGSMEHDPNSDGLVCGRVAPPSYRGSLDDFWSLCGEWYESRGIIREQWDEFPLRRGFDKGDIMLLVGPTRGTVERGDIIVFHSREAHPIIHRVIERSTTPEGVLFQTKGDHNPDQIVVYVVADSLGRVSPCHSGGVPVPCAAGSPVRRDVPGAFAVLDEMAVSEDALIGRAVLRIPWLGWIKIGFSEAVSWLFSRE